MHGEGTHCPYAHGKELAVVICQICYQPPWELSPWLHPNNKALSFHMLLHWVLSGLTLPGPPIHIFLYMYMAYYTFEVWSAEQEHLRVISVYKPSMDFSVLINATYSKMSSQQHTHLLFTDQRNINNCLIILIRLFFLFTAEVEDFGLSQALPKGQCNTYQMIRGSFILQEILTLILTWAICANKQMRNIVTPTITWQLLYFHPFIYFSHLSWLALCYSEERLPAWSKS